MRTSNEQSIKTILKELVETYRLQSQLHQTKIEQIWEQAMGKMIRNYTRELKVRNHKLYVTVESAPLRQELAYGRDRILQTINKELGEEYLREVIIR